MNMSEGWKTEERKDTRLHATLQKRPLDDYENVPTLSYKRMKVPQEDVKNGTPEQETGQEENVTYVDSSQVFDSTVVNAPSDGNPDLIEKETGCRCRKTKCLKLYCTCFRNDVRCTSHCGCRACENNGLHEEARLRAVRIARFNVPGCFQGTAMMLEEQEDSMRSGAKRSVRGCHCMQSRCKKKYCECHGAGLRCGANCICENCLNFETQKDGAASLTRVDPIPPPRSDNPQRTIPRNQQPPLMMEGTSERARGNFSANDFDEGRAYDSAPSEWEFCSDGDDNVVMSADDEDLQSMEWWQDEALPEVGSLAGEGGIEGEIAEHRSLNVTQDQGEEVMTPSKADWTPPSLCLSRQVSDVIRIGRDTSGLLWGDLGRESSVDCWRTLSIDGSDLDKLRRRESSSEHSIAEHVRG